MPARSKAARMRGGVEPAIVVAEHRVHAERRAQRAKRVGRHLGRDERAADDGRHDVVAREQDQSRGRRRSCVR